MRQKIQELKIKKKTSYICRIMQFTKIVENKWHVEQCRYAMRRDKSIAHCVTVVVVVYPTPSEGWGMAEDHGAPEACQLRRVWIRGRRETGSRQRVSGAKSP